MKPFVIAVALALMAAPVFAQSGAAARQGITEPGAASLATAAGHEVSAGVNTYTYREPGDTAISIHGPKFVGAYTGTRVLDARRHWFLQAQGSGALGNATYDGWCSPFLIRPDNTSPNGYALGFGDPSPCSESGDRDWYIEGRGVVGKDLVGERWAWSPYSGLGVRHLSNGTTGAAGYRTDNYLYLPLGLTARTGVGSRRVLGVTFEFDVLLRGWQQTRGSKLGGGEVPATPTTPAFTIESFSDVSFTQRRGWAVRASAAYPITARWSLEPYYVRWEVNDSPVEDQAITFTVHNVTARQLVGFYEPFNTTNEAGVRIGFHF